MGDFDQDGEYEAELDTAAEAYFDSLYEELGPQWAEDHAEELCQRFYEKNYDDAVKEFTSELLRSYFIVHPDLAGPAREMLAYAQRLMPSFPTAALVFAVTATELVVKTVLLRPIIFGLVHTEDLGSFITDLAVKQTGMDRFRTLLTKILARFGGVDLKTFKRVGSTKTLWEEMGEIQAARNAVVHQGVMADGSKAILAISVAATLLNDIFPIIVANLGLHLHDSMTVCACAHPKH